MTLHPLARELVRSHLRRELAPNVGFAAAAIRVWSLPDEEIDLHAEQCAAEVGATVPAELLDTPPPAGGGVGATFDGHILKAIIDWVESPQGKAVISLLVTVLTALLMFA